MDRRESRVEWGRIRILGIAAIVWLWLGTSLLAQGAKPIALYDETYRPQYHFTPAKNWMNDPNGPIYYKGEYHLFYQYNPFGNVWGHMSWGHAVSRDLVHWQHLPVAIPEESGIMIFSGSTVVDWHNSSGLCHDANAAESSCLVAIYTGRTETLQTQNLAYSNDQGRTWTKYPGNPVLDLHMQDYRDPKVFRHEPSHKWVMVAALPTEHKVRFFGSTDLKHWTALSDFGPAGGTAGVWECPDLFPLPVEGEAGQPRWVLSINLNPGGLAGGSADQYFVGQFDGATFVNANPSSQVLWADYGKDFYASTSFSDIPATDGRRIWLGWLLNWEYAAKVPTFPWRGVQSIPRVLSLKRFPEGIRLVQSPAKELATLRQNHVSLDAQDVASANRALLTKKVRGDALEIIAELDGGNSAEAGIRVRKGTDEATTIGVDWGKQEVFVDRTRSGDTSFDERFAGRHAGPLLPAGGKRVKLHIFVDRSSVEVFVNDGSTVISDAIFPSRDSQDIELFSTNGEARIVNLEVWTLRSAWR
ncbi:MAG: glycoside hydrolase family 32 protein [Candidatus Acidiferrum sp.]